MGAPGFVLFCGKGHQVHWWDEHLYWTDEMFKDKKRIEEGGCLCGDKGVLVIAHYGSINDCICLDADQEEKGIKATGKVDKLLVPSTDALDRNGNPLEDVYHVVYLTVYHIPDNVRDGSIWKA